MFSICLFLLPYSNYYIIHSFQKLFRFWCYQKLNVGPQPHSASRLLQRLCSPEWPWCDGHVSGTQSLCAGLSSVLHPLPGTLILRPSYGHTCLVGGLPHHRKTILAVMVYIHWQPPWPSGRQDSTVLGLRLHSLQLSAAPPQTAPVCLSVPLCTGVGLASV